MTWSYVAFQTASDARQRLANAVDVTGLRLDDDGEARVDRVQDRRGIGKELLFE